MTPTKLIAAFEVLADAPDGVKRLRELVLSLAVRGKLVPQVEGEGSAQLGALPDGKGRRSKRVAEVQHVPPFDLPAQWAWVALGRASREWGSKLPDQPFTYIDVGSIDNERGVVAAEPDVLEPADAPSRARKLVRLGSVVYSTVRPYLLNIAVIDRTFAPEPIVSTAFAVLHPVEGLNERFLYWVLRSPFFVDFVSETMKGVAYPAISDKELLAGPIPVPPLAEQRRIVARVDELMGLIDRLEAARTACDESRRAARDAALAALRNAPTPEALQAAWGRLANCTEDLFCEDGDVAPLRQAIREAAIHGQLVRQKPADEPASLLLERIRRRMQSLVVSGSVRKREPQPAVDRESVFALPPNWQWARLNDLLLSLGDGPHFSPKYVDAESGVPFLSTRNLEVDSFKLDNVKFVSEADHAEFCKKVKPEQGDILYTKGGTTGIAVVNDLPFEFSVWVHVAVLKPDRENVCPRYLALALNSPHCYEQSQRYTHGIGNRDLGLTRMVKITVPVPPLAEQQRIVAKVDELMAVCDIWEVRLEEARELKAQFAAAAVHYLEM